MHPIVFGKRNAAVLFLRSMILELLGFVLAHATKVQITYEGICSTEERDKLVGYRAGDGAPNLPITAFVVMIALFFGR